ncbi:MAG: 6-carboxytetrahydropterin synthase [Gemmatimonadetes bacterium]|nr:6-carboxytetrahydropterin synthase [Gemmatimonadota bacterium]
MTTMPHFLLSAETSFSAAHRLPGVDRCDRIHGHDWRVRLTVRVDAAALGANGMAVDFREVERTARAAVEDFEHRDLNQLDAFAGTAPTAEQVARIVSDRAHAQLARSTPAARVEEVEVWETPTYRVVYRPS